MELIQFQKVTVGCHNSQVYTYYAVIIMMHLCWTQFTSHTESTAVCMKYASPSLTADSDMMYNSKVTKVWLGVVPCQRAFRVILREINDRAQIILSVHASGNDASVVLKEPATRQCTLAAWIPHGAVRQLSKINQASVKPELGEWR